MTAQVEIGVRLELADIVAAMALTAQRHSRTSKPKVAPPIPNACLTLASSAFRATGKRKWAGTGGER